MTLPALSGFLCSWLRLGMKKGKASAHFPYGKDNHFLRQMQMDNEISLLLERHKSACGKIVFQQHVIRFYLLSLQEIWCRC